VADIGAFRWFESSHQLMAWVGLVPHDYSSGGKEKRGESPRRATDTYRSRLGVPPVERLASASSQPCRTNLPRSSSTPAKTQVRLCQRYAQMVGRGKKPQGTVTAVPREICPIAWGLMTLQAVPCWHLRL
jgi:transposase